MTLTVNERTVTALSRQVQLSGGHIMITLRIAMGIALLCVALASSTVLAAAGEFDPSFNRVGFTRDYLDGPTVGLGLGIHSTDEIVTAGYLNDVEGTFTDLVLFRHLADGSLDPRFGGTGIVYPARPPGILVFNNGNSLAIDNQDRIVLLTMTGNPFNYVAYRFNFDGSPDSSFSETGRVIVPIGRNIYALTGVTTQPDAKIVGVGGAINPDTNHFEFFVFRLQENGELDPGFGGSGGVWTQVTPGGGDDRATGVAIQPDGKIVVGGRARVLDPAANFDFALVRYSSSGELDDSFGTGGKVIISLLDDNLGRTPVIQPDGKIVLAGYACDEIGGGNEYCHFGLVRVDDRGALDPSFGGTGIVTTDVGDGYAADVALQSDNKIVAVGPHNVSARIINATLVRYLPDGSLDLTFGFNGISESNYGYPVSNGRNVRLQSDGRIVVAGSTSSRTLTSISAVTARYLANGGE